MTKIKMQVEIELVSTAFTEESADLTALGEDIGDGLECSLEDLIRDDLDTHNLAVKINDRSVYTVSTWVEDK